MKRSIRDGEQWLNVSLGDREVKIRDGRPEWSRDEDRMYIRTKWGRLYFDSVERRPEMERIARIMFPKIGADRWNGGPGAWGFACDSFSSGTLVWISNDGETARYGRAWVSSLEPSFKVVSAE